MGDNLATFNPAQKIKYIGAIESLRNNKQQMWSWIPKADEDGGGALVGAAGPGITTKSVNFAVHLGRNAAGGYQDPEGNFATAGSQRYKQGLMQGRTGYWPTSISLAALERTKTDPAAFARIQIEAAMRTGNDFRNEDERILLGDGTGTLGVVSSVAFDTSIDGAGQDGLIITIDNFQDARKFAKGQYLNFWSARTAGATQKAIWTDAAATATDNVALVYNVTVAGSVATVIIQGINNGTVVSATHDLVAGDVITKANDQNVGTYNGARAASTRFEPMGLLGITLDCDTPMENGVTIGGLYAINATTQYAAMQSATPGTTNAGGEADWQGYNNRSATARGINNLILQSLRDMPDINCGECPNIYVTTYGGRMEFVNTLTGIRRNVNTTSVSGQHGGGFSENLDARKYPEYDDTPIIPSRYAPSYRSTAGNTGTPLAATYLGLNTGYLKIHQWHKMQFIDADGQTWRMFTRAPFVEAILGHTWELKTNKRNAHSAAHMILASDFS